MAPRPSALRAPSSGDGSAAWDGVGSSDLLDELLAQEPNETDALLLELLSEQPEAADNETLPHQTTAPAASYTGISVGAVPTQLTVTHCGPTAAHSRAKQTLHSLRAEVNQLTSSLKRLQDDSSIPQQPHVRSAMERATAERLKRRRVEHECKQLRAAVYAQSQFLRGLRCVFSGCTPLSSLTAMDLSRYLHNYTRLPRDRSTRWNEYAALAQEARLESAMDILCRETKVMRVSDEFEDEIVPSLDSPLIQTELLAHHDGFSMTSTNVYALATDDLSAALRGVCVAVREIVARSQAYECTSRKRQIVDPDAALPSSTASSILYRVMGVDHRNPHDGDELSIESRNITLYKQTSDYAVLLEDFVDEDELYPQDDATNITRQVVGACLVRRELCSDGSEHTVFRALRTRRYRFHPHTPPAVLQRYQQLIAATMEANDYVFRNIIQQTIAHEERVLAQAQDQLSALQ